MRTARREGKGAVECEDADLEGESAQRVAKLEPQIWILKAVCVKFSLTRSMKLLDEYSEETQRRQTRESQGELAGDASGS